MVDKTLYLSKDISQQFAAPHNDKGKKHAGGDNPKGADAYRGKDTGIFYQ